MMTRRSAALRLAALLLAGACRSSVPGPAEATITLIVENRAFADVNVYAVRSEGGQGIRLATVNGGTTRILRVRQSALQPGGRMMLNVRAISANSSWTSPAIPVNTNSVAKLDVIASGQTDLSQSQFYLRQ